MDTLTSNCEFNLDGFDLTPTLLAPSVISDAEEAINRYVHADFTHYKV